MKKIAKSKGVMISSIISLLLSMVLLATVSLAWLSMNVETESKGMQLKVEVTPNLIIDGIRSGESASTVEDRITVVEGPTDTNFSVTFNQADEKLRPATHDSTYGTYTTGLKYVTNQQNVDVSTGVASSAVYSDAVNVNSPTVKHYYVDYVVYLASTGVAMPVTSLTAEIVAANCKIGGVTSDSNTTLKAASIDFYLGTPGSGTYKGTLNVAGLAYDSNANGSYNGTTYTPVTLMSSGTIPYNQADEGDQYIIVTMRCYFDGALSSATNQTFINTSTVDTDNVELVVKFTATANY